MLFNPTRRCAPPLAQPKDRPLSSKHDSDEHALKKIEDIVTTLMRYESRATVPERIQWSQKTRDALEIPRALLKAGALFAPAPLPSHACSPDSPLNRKIPRP